MLTVVAATLAITGRHDGTATHKAPTATFTGHEATHTLVWSDEFDAPAGTPADPARWTHDVGGGGWGNEQLEYDTQGAENVAHDGEGHLVITARSEGTEAYDCWYGPCRYTSGRINTANKATARYGRIEARMQVPEGQGLWPAFWMLGEDLPTKGWPAAGEIDIMENVGHEPGTVHGSLHGPGYSAADSLTGSYVLPDGARLSDDFHTYAVDWSPGAVSFSIDGVHYTTKTSNDTEDWAHDVASSFLILNLAVGGTWPGEPESDAVFPAELVVDRVAVYEENNPEPTHDAAAGIAAETAAWQQGAVVHPENKTVGAAETQAADETTDLAGGAVEKDPHDTVVGNLAPGDWLGYRNVDLGAGGTGWVKLRVASGAHVGGQIEVRVDTLGGPPLAVVDVSPTGGWANWETVRAPVRLPAGAHSVYLTFAGAEPVEFVDVEDFTLRAAATGS